MPQQQMVRVGLALARPPLNRHTFEANVAAVNLPTTANAAHCRYDRQHLFMAQMNYSDAPDNNLNARFFAEKSFDLATFLCQQFTIFSADLAVVISQTSRSLLS